MKLTDLTREYIAEVSSPIVFEIGEGYHRTGRVTALKYDEDAATVTATVPGMSGERSRHYQVKITEKDGEIEAECDCFSDEHACKHAIAVMLKFVESDQYLRKIETVKERIEPLELKVDDLSKEKLAEMVMDCARKYPDFNIELMVRLAEYEQETADEQKAVDTIRKQIEEAFPSQGDSYSTSQTARKLKAMTESIDAAPDTMKMEVYWAILGKVLENLSEYGMGDETLKSIAIDYMDIVVSLLKDNNELGQRRREIVEGLMEYYQRDKCGLGDRIYEMAHDLLKDTSDYQIVVDCMERIAKSPSCPGRTRGLLADLYKEMGDEEARLRTLESKLRDGMDYWRLAQYWIDKEQDEKVLALVKEGIEKGEGGTERLYSYMQEHYESQGDYNAILRLLESKIQKSGADYYSVEGDEMYKCLINHYESTDDYIGIVELLNLRLAHGNIDFGLYRQAEGILKESDLADFQEKFVARVKERGILR